MPNDKTTKESGTEKYQPPKPEVGDAAHTLARAGISAIPVIGGVGVELFSAIVQPPLERRRNEWMKEIGDGLKSLEDADLVRLADLSENDIFLDAVLSASQAAMRTSQDEKKKALRNAVLNAALPSPPEESRQQFFFHIIDIFTVWHLRLLKLFQDPAHWFIENEKEWPNIAIGGLDSILESAFPELQGQRDFYDQIWKDINNYGLTRTPSLQSAMSTDGLKAQRASELGNEFLDFIEAPDIEG